MRLSDYLRLGFAGVKAHKKRASAVVIIVGLLFSVIVAVAFVLQGLENAVLAGMLAPTDGKVLLMNSVDTEVCGEDCDIKTEIANIKKSVEKYDGEAITAGVVQNTGDVFYRLDEKVFKDVPSNVDSDVMQVAIPLVTATKLAGIEMPGHDASVEVKVRAISEARERILHQVIESEAGEKYYVAEILPGWMYTNDLSLANTKRAGEKTDNNPLDLILMQLPTGTRQNFVMNDVATEESEIVFARFENVKSAYKYYRDEANYCAEFDHIFANCGENYRYWVAPAVADPLRTYEVFRNVWTVFEIAAAVLGVIAVIIALSTYARLINKDIKLISLYYAMGATKRQIRAIYIVYLMMLSMMAVVFAIIIGLVLATIFSAVNMTGLSQTFALGLGVIQERIFLVGWNNLILVTVPVMALVAIVAVVFGNGNFSAKELAKKLK